MSCGTASSATGAEAGAIGAGATGATGAVEAIAAIMALKDGVIPPTINLDAPDEGLDLNYTPNKAVKRDVDVAISTNLGFGGHDACVVFKKI